MLLGSSPAVFAAEGSLSNFSKRYTYNEGRFVDVQGDKWYADSVKAAYEYGLVIGVSENSYAPEDNVTIAETITLASRLNNIYNGNEVDLESLMGSVWYEPYLDYALDHGIVNQGDYIEYNVPANRQQFAYLIAKALPASALPAVNSIGDNKIPDMKSSDFYGPSVYLLYNAGILTGMDKNGTFEPYKNISRAEVAAILSRMSDPSLRKSFVLSGLQGKEFLNMTNKEVIALVGPLCTADQQKTGVLASVTLAQFILESGYGKSSLTTEANNCFGMKASLSGNKWAGSAWDGKSICTKVTKEHNPDGSTYTITANFRKYDSVEDSIADHSAYLLASKNGSKLRYEGLKGEKDYRTAAQIIKDGGYATSTTYVDDLCKIIEKWDLTKYEAKN